MKNSDSYIQNNKRLRLNNHSFNSLNSQIKKPKLAISKTASIYIKTFGTPLISKTTGASVESIHLPPNKPYTIGRSRSRCDFVFEDRNVSKEHCQIYFDAYNKKICVADGVSNFSLSDCSRVRVSLNGVFVDRVRIRNREIKEVGAGSEVSLVCANEDICSFGARIGFVVEKIVLLEEVNDRNLVTYREDCLYSNNVFGKLGCNKLANADFLWNKCRQILSSDDPVLYIKECFANPCKLRAKCVSRNRAKSCHTPNDYLEHLVSDAPKLNSCEANVTDGCLQHHINARFSLKECISNDKYSEVSTGEENIVRAAQLLQPKKRGLCVPPPGNKFYLNRLHFMSEGQSSDEVNVSLPELLYPVETLERVFIATFTSDLSWFLSYCAIPAHLPITIACHNAERCWSSSPDKRTSVPYSDHPNLVVVYPHFPEEISFTKERKKFGIACHHPKLFVLQRESSIRIIITSANLVEKQWLRVTNTVWWQDFPRASAPDYMSLFARSSSEEVSQDSKDDFSSQLAGFMAALLVDAPNQAHWILELTKFDFSGAAGHLVASVPGIYSPRHPYVQSVHYLTGDHCMQQTFGSMLLGTVEASVVGISHLFRTSADSNGLLLKKLANVVRVCHVNAYGMSEVILRRNVNIAADANAISVFISKSKESFEGDCVQLGFLPRDVAKWVAPLSDVGCFAFSAYINPKEVLECALEGSNKKVHLILYVSQGPNCLNRSQFGQSQFDQPSLASAICSLVASVQRCYGLWRLHEILGHYKWPEHCETDFTFGASSIGAVNAPFLAAFSAATGKRSLQFSETEDSDPDWGCWTASQESRNPSIRIIFPTIERVKTASCGILASKYILCFSQKTWLRLKNLGILHDAIPYCVERVGHPMHVKVARRRFQSRTDTSSFGWVYCGSHNFSAAAWGRPIHHSFGSMRSRSVLGSKLHICNYEFGIVFVVPPSQRNDCPKQNHSNLDDIILPFVVPAPKYRPMDSPATAYAMRVALAQLSEQEREKCIEEEEELVDEEEVVPLEASEFIMEEKEDEKAYAEKLWSSS